MRQNGGVTPSVRPRRLRDARGPVAASVATSAALLSHLVAGGALPGWLGIVVPWVLSLALCTAVAGRRLSWWRTAASVAASQVLFHTLFVLGGPTAAASSSVRHPGHGTDGWPLPPSSGTPAASSAGLTEMLHADPAMWFWHGVAAVATTAALYSGEHLLVSLHGLVERTARWLRRRFATGPGPVAPRSAARVPAPDRFTGPFSARLERSPVRRRGPPHAHAT